MLIKRILAYFKAKKEQREHDRKPFYNPADGSVADRRERLVVQRKEKFREAESIYRNDFSASKYLEAMWQRVLDAQAIETYEDWEMEYIRPELKAPRVKAHPRKKRKYA
ncbi:MAG: hypothetical protein IKE91_07655 [Clostridia bacterium]|nr:hypothetical protein [Clostridia bacterium]